MLDKLFIWSNGRKDLFTPDYTPDKAVTGRKLVNQEGANLHVLFPPWHGGGTVYEKLIKRIAKKGDAVLAYYFNDQILAPSSSLVAASFENIRDTVAEDLDNVVRDHDYEHVKLIAMSLGNPALSIVASKFTDFDSVTLVDSSSSIARAMWHGSRTQGIRAGIEQEGHDLDYLEQAWRDLAPINHIDALAGKEVTLIVSTTDKIIPTRYQEELVDAMQQAGIDPSVQRTRLGHYASIGRFCLYGNL